MKNERKLKAVVIRHAERGKITPNELDPPLTDKGKKEAREFGKWIKKYMRELSIYYTPYLRTRMTAEEIAKAHGGVIEIREVSIPEWWKGNKEELCKVMQNYELAVKEWINGKLPAVSIKDYGTYILKLTLNLNDNSALFIAHDSTITALSYILNINNFVYNKPNYLEGIAFDEKGNGVSLILHSSSYKLVSVD